MLVSVLYNASDLERMFKDMGRQEQFSKDGFVALFEYLDDLSEETGEDIQIDIEALCCDFSEYDDITDYNEQNGTEYASWEDAKENDVYVVQFDRYVLPERCRHNWQSKGWSWEVEKVGGIVHG